MFGSRGSCLVTGCCQGGSLSSSLTSTNSPSPHTHARARAREDEEQEEGAKVDDDRHIHWRNQPLTGWKKLPTASKMIPVCLGARVSQVRGSVCVRQKYPASPVKEETIASRTLSACRACVRAFACAHLRKDPRCDERAPGQVQLTRLFRTEQGALSRGSLVPAIYDGGIIVRGVPPARNIAPSKSTRSIPALISLRFAAR